MNENCVTGKKGTFIAWGTAIPSRWQPLYCHGKQQDQRGAAWRCCFLSHKDISPCCHLPCDAEGFLASNSLKSFVFPGCQDCCRHQCSSPGTVLQEITSSWWRGIAAARVHWWFYKERQRPNGKARKTFPLISTWEERSEKPTGL